MLKRILDGTLLSLGVAALCLVAGAAHSADGDLMLRDDAKCTLCHSASGFPQLLGIGQTKHGTRADGRTPTCTSCHGESKGHAEPAGEQAKPDVMYGKKGTPASVQNTTCLLCHQKDS